MPLLHILLWLFSATSLIFAANFHAKVLLSRTIQLLEWGKQATHVPPQANA
jgi:hypothetical protein